MAPHLGRMALVAARLGPAGERDDIMQEALMRAWRHRRKYKPDRGALSSWLVAITANVARGQWRGVRKAIWSVGAAQRVRDLDGHLDLDQAISRLSERQRLATPPA